MTGWNPEGTRYDLPDIVQPPPMVIGSVMNWGAPPLNERHGVLNQTNEEVLVYHGERLVEAVPPWSHHIFEALPAILKEDDKGNFIIPENWESNLEWRCGMTTRVQTFDDNNKGTQVWP